MIENIVIVIVCILLHYAIKENPGFCPEYCGIDHKHNIEELVYE